MPLMTATPIVVSAEERTQLEFLVRAHSTPQQLAMRGRVVLLAADNVGVREAARRLASGRRRYGHGASGGMIHRRWRRWVFVWPMRRALASRRRSRRSRFARSW